MWSWNLNGLAQWEEIDSAEVDLVLLQEAPAPPSDWDGSFVPDPNAGLATQDWKAGARRPAG